MKLLSSPYWKVLWILIMLPSCFSGSRSSSDFVASLEGRLLFTKYPDSVTWRELDFSGNRAVVKESERTTSGIVSPNGKWQLNLVEDKDSNGDGVIDFKDLKAVYLSRVNGSDRVKVPLSFPVENCVWAEKEMTAACDIMFSNIGFDDQTSTSDEVIYLVDLQSGELLQRLSDPTKVVGSLTASADGGMLAFQVGIRNEEDKGDPLETLGIQVVDSETGEIIFRISDPLAREPVWSPHGHRLAFVANLEAGIYSETWMEGKYNDVFYVDLTQEVPTPVNVTKTSRFTEVLSALTELGGITVRNPVWSPDGEAIASVWLQYDTQLIWVTSVDGDGWARLEEGANQYILYEWRP